MKNRKPHCSWDIKNVSMAPWGQGSNIVVNTDDGGVCILTDDQDKKINKQIDHETMLNR